jgi:septal ring factor EnvC (AmiA/AmiB activator)
VSQFPISETITGIIAAAIAWFSGGKYAAKGTEIDNTAKLIELWEKANHNCNEELEQMREEIKQFKAEAAEERQALNDKIKSQDQKIKVLQDHIKKMEKA